MLTTVMLVDDEIPFVEAMERRLKKRGIDVKTAFNGEDALLRLNQHPHIDVIILDVKMPGMDGLETLKNIKKAFPLVEVILLTGHATVETAIDGIKLGACEYLMKPSDMAVLMEKVKAAKARKSIHEQNVIGARVRELSLRRPD